MPRRIAAAIVVDFSAAISFAQIPDSVESHLIAARPPPASILPASAPIACAAVDHFSIREPRRIPGASRNMVIEPAKV